MDSTRKPKALSNLIILIFHSFYLSSLIFELSEQLREKGSAVNVQNYAKDGSCKEPGRLREELCAGLWSVFGSNSARFRLLAILGGHVNDGEKISIEGKSKVGLFDEVSCFRCQHSLSWD